MFFQTGGKLQEKFYNLLIERLGKNMRGKIIDIGSGNGVLAAKLAQQREKIEVVGIDYWGTDWEYSKSVCEKNAETAHVRDRVHFQKGDAAALDFDSNTFDGAISNLIFREVKSASDKRSVVEEALRDVKSGGCFAFIDYFYDEKYYGNSLAFEKFLGSMNLAHLEYKPLQDLIAIPALLKHPKILGRVGIIYGSK
jgi:ubiquinone/menaquinone biosynthesis C-methylase UbiE